jgi:hypothetical protein
MPQMQSAAQGFGPAAPAAGVAQIAAPPELASEVAESLRDSVEEAVRQCFQDVLLPGVLASAREMFSQMNDALQKSAERQIENEDHEQEVLEELKGAAQNLSRISQVLDSQLAELNERGAAGPARREPQSAEDDALVAARDALAKGNVEAAFLAVLSSGRLELVVWLCRQFAPQHAFGEHELPNHIILSLIQQLAFNLRDDVSLKLQWLDEALLAINLDDPTISEHVGPILEQVQANVDSCVLPPDPADPAHNSARHIKYFLRNRRKRASMGGAR